MKKKQKERIHLKHRVWIFDYDNFRTYLRDVYLQSKSLDPKYSYRYFANAAGYKSASALLEIINGKKNLSLEGSQKFAKALKLSQAETQYFKTLVQFTQTAATEKRLELTKTLNRLRSSKKIFTLAETQYRLFEKWYYTAIAEMVTLVDFKEDPEWIADRLVPPIQPRQAARALEELLNLGILKRNDQGQLVPGQPDVTTPDEVYSVYVANWHREHLKKAAESIDLVAREKRDISGVYFSVSEQNIRRIKELIHIFRKEVLEVASQDNNRDAVYQLNLQLFPVAASNDKEKKS